ncbi:prolyl oligopeptidase family serine peptidase [Pseudobacteriovorax antillogorgiicola]|uniref:Prolyl oligopeptidase family protein n=1 Tax=Pseudobacteriovorax antillogorgiicola TaxID=1513793 RepID=A0A1Y6CQR0_9BACT|nr:prolyl oligopeptidase family serine peptidase [Pseudobacteriovorax antillogorgiicola]TCS42718.1 prolyl oligopeptidase family protein [Pseudobacteriovorax antillogorgiicola]SMF82453.1 Prolyl oligopeptidase family protein [Pseudobacteriovorax antillogorgiicola]
MIIRHLVLLTLFLGLLSAQGKAEIGEVSETSVTWALGVVDNPSDDPIRPLLENRSFSLPKEGQINGSVTWSNIQAGEGGKLDVGGASRFYVATEIDVKPGEHIYVQGDRIISFYTNNAWKKSGDVYGSGTIRIPLATKPGKNLLVAYGFGSWSTPEISVYKTIDRVTFNTDDLTKPDLRVGDDSTLWLGLPLLNLGSTPVKNVEASVLKGQYFKGSTIVHRSIGSASMTQLAFRLEPQGPWSESLVDQPIPVEIAVKSKSLNRIYKRLFHLKIVSRRQNHARTKRSKVDGSVQFYGVLPPSEEPEVEKPGMILSLHGAGVQATGQSNAYSAKSWAYLVAPTNRRPFGFDWEEWGRLDALETLEDAENAFNTDKKRTHLTGHSMGGHGTWHLGVNYPDRFGVVAPSAGWISFNTYGSSPIASGVLGRARSASITTNLVSNLRSNLVYIIHGMDDQNVPAQQAETMFKLLEPIVDNLTFHRQENAGHWWDVNEEAGSDCVDWEPMISLMEQTTIQDKRDFRFISTNPSVNGKYSFVKVSSAWSPLENVSIASSQVGNQLVLETTNARSLEINSKMLAGWGVGSLSVDGTHYDVDEKSTILVGDQSGKRQDLYGPMNQVYHKPWCFVYQETGSRIYEEYASYLETQWSIIGNGQSCSLPWAALDEKTRERFNLVYLGIPFNELDIPAQMEISWQKDEIKVGDKILRDSMLGLIFPENNRLSAAWTVTSGSEYLLFRYQPFSSRNGLADFHVFNGEGSVLTGFFDANWRYSDKLTEVLNDSSQ